MKIHFSANTFPILKLISIKKFTISISVTIYVMTAFSTSKAEADSVPTENNKCINILEKAGAPTRLQCSANSEVIILNEAHFNEESLQIKEITEDLSVNGDIYGFFEGRSFDDSTSKENTMFGLEDDLVKGISNLRVSLPILPIAMSSDPQNRNEIQVYNLSKIAFFQGIFLMRSIWGDFTWLPDLSEASGFCIKNFRKMKLPYDEPTIQVMKNACSDFNPSQDDYKVMYEMGKNLLQVAMRIIQNDANYNFLRYVDEAELMGLGRSLIFARTVQKKFCAASADSKPLWIQIGKGHSFELQCLLQNMLPEKTRIKAVEPAMFREKLSQFERTLNTVVAEIQKYLDRLGKKANAHIGVKGYIIIESYSKELDDKKIEKIIASHGLNVIRWKSTKSLASFSAMYKVVMNPFK